MIPLRNIRRFLHKSLKAPRYALKVFVRRLWAHAYYRLGNGKSSPPEAITFFLTHRCNLRCKMCGQWGDRGVTKAQDDLILKKELSLEECKRIIDDCATFKPNITLFGGEPLLHPHCIELIRYITQKKMHCLIITNASLVEAQAGKIVDSGLDELNVSIDGLASRHDHIRGMPGLYEKITGGLKKIHYLKKTQGRVRPRINVQCTISKYNYTHLEELLTIAQEVHADSLTFHNLIFLERDAIEKQKEFDTLLHCSSKDWQGFNAVSGIKPELLYKKIHDIMSGSYPFSVDFYPNLSRTELISYYKFTGYAPKEYACRCLSPWIAGYIFPDGELRPCLNSSYSFGNLTQRAFKDIWNSPEAIVFRTTLKRKGIFPACVRCTELYRY